MQNISITRPPHDPEAQGLIAPEDGKWQLLIDKDGYPHLYVEVTVRDDDGHLRKGMLAIEHVMPDGTTIPDLMTSIFEGQLTPEELEAAQRDLAASPVPCPRL